MCILQIDQIYVRPLPWFQILPQIQGTKINEFFDIVRPIIEFKFEIILARSNNIFELQTQENIDVLLKVYINIRFTSNTLNYIKIKHNLSLSLQNFSNLQGDGGGGGGGDDDDMDENLMAEEVDNTLHFKGLNQSRKTCIVQKNPGTIHL